MKFFKPTLMVANETYMWLTNTSAKPYLGKKDLEYLINEREALKSFLSIFPLPDTEKR